MQKRVVHLTVTGHRVEYDEPDGKLARFLARVEKLAGDPKTTEDDLVSVIYSAENPILAPSPFGDRGIVTRETLGNPVYRVLTDILRRKDFAERRVDIAKLSAGYTLSVVEAAERIGVHESAVRQAIAANRIASWVKDGRHYLHPKWVDQFAEGIEQKSKTRNVEPESTPKRSRVANSR